jgi:hypothetical protein
VKAVEREPWPLANQRYLMACVREIACAFDGTVDAETRRAVVEARAMLPAPAAIELLCAAFDLSPFERAVVLLCAGVELDASLAERCARAQGDGRRSAPTFGLVLSLLPDAHWSALVPAAPLRRWNLVTLAPERLLTESALHLDERILHYLAGIDELDERLAAVLEPLDAQPAPPSLAALALGIAQLWSQSAPARVQLCGGDPVAQRAIVAAAAQTLHARALLLRAPDVPLDVAERTALARAWERERRLSGAVLALEGPFESGATAWPRFVEACGGQVALLGRDTGGAAVRDLVRIEIPAASFAQRREAWASALGAVGGADAVDQLAAQFQLEPAQIDAVCAQVRATSGGVVEPVPAWEVCRRLARSALDDLAQRIDAVAGWDDLVLPPAQRGILREIRAHVRLRHTVHERWGFGAASARGLGICALFAGPSGSGKTMAAEVLGNDLGLDVYRIDLAAVVSKYIGETEKNLRRIFDAAESGAAILLFDEADALFGKRSDVRDSHDRYANIEVSYLLQRMEAYRGLAILTSNLKSALDPAFLRRLRFIVHFPFPDLAERAEIWRRVFPPQTPTRDLRPEQLARLSLSGGTIRNVALAAAFLAAQDGGPVTMARLARAARGELAKLEKPFSEAEIAEWR